MKSIKYFSLFIISLLIFSFKGISNPTFDLGVKSYMSKEYEKSTIAFQSLVNDGYQSHTLYYNLACAYFKTENYAQAMLWFERAKRLNPNHEDTEFNVNVTKYKLVDKIEAIPELFFIKWWKTFLNIMNEKEWSIVSVILFFMVFVFIGVFLITNSYFFRKASFYGGIVTLFLFFVSFVAAYSQSKWLLNKNEAIIISKKLEIKSSPDLSSKDIFVVHEGIKVYINDKIGEWVEIRLPNGDKGWVQLANLEII